MHDARARRHDAQIVEGGLGPAEEAVSFAVALVFAVDILGQGRGNAGEVDLHRVIDDQVYGHYRVNLLRIAATPGYFRAHCRKVDYGGDAGEVLHEDTGGHERDICPTYIVGRPTRDGGYVILRDRAIAAVAQHVFEQHPNGERECGQVDTVLFGGNVEVVIGNGSGRGDKALLHLVQVAISCHWSPVYEVCGKASAGRLTVGSISRRPEPIRRAPVPHPRAPCPPDRPRSRSPLG